MCFRMRNSQNSHFLRKFCEISHSHRFAEPLSDSHNFRKMRTKFSLAKTSQNANFVHPCLPLFVSRFHFTSTLSAATLPKSLNIPKSSTTLESCFTLFLDFCRLFFSLFAAIQQLKLATWLLFVPFRSVFWRWAGSRHLERQNTDRAEPSRLWAWDFWLFFQLFMLISR